MKRRIVILTVLMLLLALTRIPGLAPWNFSAVYAMAFCAGAYFRGRWLWLLPLGVMLVTDGLLSAYQARLLLQLLLTTTTDRDTLRAAFAAAGPP